MLARTYFLILLASTCGSSVTGFAQPQPSPNQNLGRLPVHYGQKQPQAYAGFDIWAQGQQPSVDAIQTSAEQDSRDAKASEVRPNPNGQAAVSVGQLKLSEKARGALHRAWVAIGKEKLGEAARYVEKALALSPRSAEALTFRAAIKAQDVDSREEARADAEKAVEYDPNYAGAYVILGSIYCTLGQYDDAIRTLDRGIALTPTNWAGYYEMSIALLGKRDYASALRQAEKASRLESRNFPPIHLVKAYAYIGLRNRSAAATELDAFQRLSPDSPLLPRAKKTLDEMLPIDRDSQADVQR